MYPESDTQLRELAVDHVLRYAAKYGMKFTKDERRKCVAMRRPGRVPSESVLLAVAVAMKVEVWIHHGGLTTVVYKEEETNHAMKIPKIHLQCISGLHFNPVETNLEADEYDYLVKPKHVNVLHKAESKEITAWTEIEDEQVNLQKVCLHGDDANSRCKIQLGNQYVCALVDTGAQVNVIGESLCEGLRARDEVSFQPIHGKVVGIGRHRTSVRGILTASVYVREDLSPLQVEFAIIPDQCMPCCCLLGAGFLETHQVVLDFSQHAVYFGTITSVYRDQPIREPMMGLKCQSSKARKVIAHAEFVSDKDISDVNVRYVITPDALKGLQNRDSAIRTLKTQVRKRIHSREWRSHTLRQFKGYWGKYHLNQEILLVEVNDRQVPVLPFRAFVETCHQTHCRLAHVGRPKLLEMMLRHFWHPSIHKVTRDICTSCVFCQLHKSSSQRVTPPIIKIQSSGPYDLVALDLLQLPQTPRRHVCILFAVDHFSKFAMAAILKDKTSRSVCQALKTQIFPHMLRLPSI